LAKRPVRGAREGALTDDLLTLGDAAALVGKTTSNISYLVQYNRLRRYDSSGRVVRRAPNGGLRVSKSELLGYVESWNHRVRSRMEELKIGDTSIAFLDVPERERTKHVHRLHPYLGKFIPQLVGYFLSRYFLPGQTVLDPFTGPGTTLVEASERGIHSVGIEISEFNVMISRVKLADYEVPAMEREVIDISRRTAEFSAKEFPEGKGARLGWERKEEGGYLETWFAPRSLREMLYFGSLIPEYEHQDILKVLLSRTARSCRLVHHYDLATPKEPVRGPYVCYKHMGKTCVPITTIVPRLRFYSVDTVRRIREFQKVRRPAASLVIEGDSRTVRLDDLLGSEAASGRGGWTGSSLLPPTSGRSIITSSTGTRTSSSGSRGGTGLRLVRRPGQGGARAERLREEHGRVAPQRERAHVVRRGGPPRRQRQARPLPGDLRGGGDAHREILREAGGGHDREGQEALLGDGLPGAARELDRARARPEAYSDSSLTRIRAFSSAFTSLSALSQPSRQSCEIRGMRVTIRAVMTEPTETKAITEAKIFPESVTSCMGGPCPVASMLSKYTAFTQSIPSIWWNPTVPTTMTAAMPEIE
jgi:hypothetical protein